MFYSVIQLIYLLFLLRNTIHLNVLRFSNKTTSIFAIDANVTRINTYFMLHKQHFYKNRQKIFPSRKRSFKVYVVKKLPSNRYPIIQRLSRDFSSFHASMNITQNTILFFAQPLFLSLNTSFTKREPFRCTVSAFCEKIKTAILGQQNTRIKKSIAIKNYFSALVGFRNVIKKKVL